ncbi:MAG: hypothetical protein RQ757_04850 [Pseudomonadales bacterium]|nr:hypothetical protein [Pseudomonadales bacterium]
MSVVNPTGFLKPGDGVEILLRVTNPADSGITLNGVIGVSSNMNADASLAFGDIQKVFKATELCEDDNVCPYPEGSFPVKPGENLTLAFRRLQAIDEIPQNTLLILSNIHLSTHLQGKQVSIPVNGIAAYQVTADGSGDPAIFDELTINFPPFVPPELTVNFRHPPQIWAGEPFNVTATIKNTGTEMVELRPISSFTRFTWSAGSHRESYEWQGCTQLCVLQGQSELAPGQSLVQDLGNFFYTADTLFSGELRLGELDLRTSDSYQRNGSVIIGQDVIRIQVINPAGGETPNPGVLTKPTEPLQSIPPADGQQFTVIRDPNTGYDWLPLAATLGQDPAQVLEQLGAGGPFAGFRRARASQVEQLVRNVLHSTRPDIPGHRIYQSDDSVNEALIQLLDIFGITLEGTFGVVSPQEPIIFSGVFFGVVDDQPPYPAVQQSAHTAINHQIFRPGQFFRPISAGSHMGVIEFTPLFGFPTATWLVRTGEQEPQFGPLEARYHNDSLVVPLVEVDGQYFSATFNFLNKVGSWMQLNTLQARDFVAGAEIARFDPVARQIVIPRVSFLDGEQTLQFRLVLDYQPDSFIPLFTLVEAEPL